MKQLLTFPRSIWRNRNDKDDQPRFLTYIVSFTCNARCIMCDSWKKPSENELTLEEIKTIFQQLPRMDALRLTGGEPFVRKDLGEIVRLAEDHLKPYAIHITSNGFLSKRIIEFCEQRNRKVPLHLLISLDGVEAKHNHVRGKETAWKFSMKTLRELAPRQEELNIQLGVNQTIVDAEGVAHYCLLRDELKPLDVKHFAVMAYDASATYSTEQAINLAPDTEGQFYTATSFSQEELENLILEVENDIAQLPASERFAKRYYWRGIAQRLLNKNDVQKNSTLNPKCVALSSHLRLYPDGRVPTCQFNSNTVGNLREQRFVELWQSEKKKKQREWVKSCAGCWAECEVLPNAVYSGDLLKETIKSSALV